MLKNRSAHKVEKLPNNLLRASLNGKKKASLKALKALKVKPTVLFAPLSFAAVFGFISLSGCNQVNSPAQVTKPINIELTAEGLEDISNLTLDRVVISNAKNWRLSANLFYKTTQSFCDKGKTGIKNADLSSVKVRYQDLARQWHQNIMFDFGPMRDNLFFPKVHFVDSMRQRGKDYSATIQSHFKQRLADNKALDHQYFSKLKFTLVGMPALEQLIYTNSAQSFNNARQCQLLTGLAKLNADNSDYVVNGWLKPAQQTGLNFREIYQTNKFADGEPALTKLIFALQDYLRYVRQRKINGKLDYALSGLEYENMAIGLKTVMTTLSAKNSGYGLTDYMIKANKAEVVNAFTNKANQALDAIEKRDLTAIAASYSDLIKMLEKDIPQALGVNLGMNFVDGD